MNILMLSDVYFPRVNGVSTSIRTFARELRRLGHGVTIVAPHYDHAEDMDDGIEILRLPASKIFFDPEDRLIRRGALHANAVQLARRRWDVIHVHTPFRAHQLGVMLRKFTGRPLVETYHTYFEPYAKHYFPWLPAAPLRYVARRISRKLCAEVDHLIVPTQQMDDVLKQYGIATPATIIPTGIDLDEFHGGDGSGFRRAHGIGAEQPVLVTVSRLAAEKNIGFLLEVTKTLLAEFPDLVFIVAGEGPDAEPLRAKAHTLGIEKHLRFPGNLDRRGALLDCYRAGDAFVFASPTETQGLVLIEAMALGVPIVSTAVMGTAAVLAGARSARIGKENVADFSNHVATLLRSPDLRAQLTAAGREDARTWSAPALMGKTVALYERLAADRG
ncbi:glycosyltransferase [Rudaea sp.]|uniref:glycosyltransferase n=1 Tax=Rudaea sp. TaxID=2136325 RepID=UPI002ED1FE0A